MQSIETAADLRSLIDAADRRFMDAMNAGDVEGAVRGVYTADARILPPGADMIEGRDAILGFWQAAVAQLGLSRVELRTVELRQAGDCAYQVGRATLTVGGGQDVEGKYVVVWKQEGGEWRWHQDIWNLNG